MPGLHPAGAPISPLGYAIWADGLGLVLDDLHRDLPGVPLLVAEYGVGTADDDFRARYLARGLEVTREALARGVDVRGFFHWTAVDNYEWLHGYDVAFGLIDRDRNVRPSADVLRREALSEAAASKRGES
jgi:beta-glucosidase